MDFLLDNVLQLCLRPCPLDGCSHCVSKLDFFRKVVSSLLAFNRQRATSAELMDCLTQQLRVVCSGVSSSTYSAKLSSYIVNQAVAYYVLANCHLLRSSSTPSAAMFLPFTKTFVNGAGAGLEWLTQYVGCCVHDPCLDTDISFLQEMALYITVKCYTR